MNRWRGLSAFVIAVATLCAPCGATAPAAPIVAALKDGEIDRAALHHDPNGLDQIVWTAAENPRLRFLTLRVTARAGDVRIVGARLYLIDAQNREGFRDHEMEVWARTDSAEIRSLTVPFEDDPGAPANRTRWRGYRFWFDDGAEIAWLGPDTTAFREESVRRYVTLFRRGPDLGGAAPGISDRMLLVPGWAQDAVVLPQSLRWRREDPDAILVSELDRLRRTLRGLDSLGVTTLLLEAPGGFPLDRCWPPDPTGDAAADSLRGATLPVGRLQALCDAAHRRRMKVMVSLAGIPGDDAATDSLCGEIRQGIGCGVDGFKLIPAPGVPDTQWRAAHETARALLPEVYLVLDGAELSPGLADPARWLTGSRVDAVRGQGVGSVLAEWLTADAPPSAEALDARLGLRRLGTPGPLCRVDWLRDPTDGADPLLDLARITFPGALELAPERLGLDAYGASAPVTGDSGHLRTLLALRRERPALRRGTFATLHATGGQFAAVRRASDELLIVVLNAAPTPADLRLPLPKGVGFVSTKDITDLLSGTRYPIRGGEIVLKAFPARTGAVLAVR